LIFKIMHETKARQLIDTDGSVAALLALSPSAIAVLRTQHLHTVAASEEHLRALFCRTTSTPCQDHSLVHTVSFVPDRPNFCFAQYIETARLVPTTIVRIRCRKARIFSGMESAAVFTEQCSEKDAYQRMHCTLSVDTRRMAGWGAVSEVAVQAASEHSTLQSPGSALLSPDPSSDDSESWSSPAQHLSFPAANPTGTAGKVPPLALPTADHNNLTKSTRLATTDPPDTPELAEANPAAPSYAFKKPPKPFSRQPKQYERSNLSKLEHVPVNWIGDSTDHTDYRPTNTASYSNHEADIVRVATFSTMGKKHDDAEAADCKQNMSRSRPRRRWCVWALVGVAAGTAIGVAYKVLGDHLALDMPDISEMQLRHGSSTRHDDSHVSHTCPHCHAACQPTAVVYLTALST